MLHAKGAENQKKRRETDALDVVYSDDPHDLGNIHDYEAFWPCWSRFMPG
jgi:hypothetical protein